jgi:hypothetical protein
MSSGVKVNKMVEDAFKSMQQKKNVPYLIFKIEDDKEVKIEKEGKPGETFEDFRCCLMEAKGSNEARYAVYDVYDEEDTGKNRTGKLLFILWADDCIGIKQKMLYTSSISAVKKSCAGYHKELECHGEEDLTLDCFREKFRK